MIFGRHWAPVPSAFVCEGWWRRRCDCGWSQGCSQMFTFTAIAPKPMLSSAFWLDRLYGLASHLLRHFWASWRLSWPWSHSSGCRTFSRQADRHEGVNLPCNSCFLMLSKKTEKFCQVQKSQSHESWPLNHETEEKSPLVWGDLGVCFSPVNFPYLLHMTCMQFYLLLDVLN